MTVTDSKAPGTWKTADGTAVPFPDATTQWAAVAHEVLVATAGRYNDYVTYRELADVVQTRSGVQTRMQMRNWIGKVLGAVSDGLVANNEPPLTSLCVTTTDHTVGDAYAYYLERKGGPAPDDLQMHAAAARLDCYEFYGAGIPAGARPTLPPKVKQARERDAAKRREETPPILCPTCNVQVPASRYCDACEG